MGHARRITPLPRGRIHVRPEGIGDDEAIARLAGVQYGVVARRQLLDLGITQRAIGYRLKRGRLRRVHLGTYAVGHDALSFRGRVMAATLTMGNGAVASHHTSAALRKLEEPSNGPIQVTVPQARRRQDGIQIFRGTPPHDEVEVLDCIPVTSVARTILDISRTESEPSVRRLVKQAEFRRLTNGTALAAILQRYPRRQGRRHLSAVARSHHMGTGPSRSEMEDLFMNFLAERDLPFPSERNVMIAVRGRELDVDCMWRDERLVVELDSRQAHATDTAFQEDRARDRLLVGAKWRPMRVTWEQLHAERDDLEADLRAVLDGDGRQ